MICGPCGAPCWRDRLRQRQVLPAERLASSSPLHRARTAHAAQPPETTVSWSYLRECGGVSQVVGHPSER